MSSLINCEYNQLTNRCRKTKSINVENDPRCFFNIATKRCNKIIKKNKKPSRNTSVAFVREVVNVPTSTEIIKEVFVTAKEIPTESTNIIKIKTQKTIKPRKKQEINYIPLSAANVTGISTSPEIMLTTRKQNNAKDVCKLKDSIMAHVKIHLPAQCDILKQSISREQYIFEELLLDNDIDIKVKKLTNEIQSLIISTKKSSRIFKELIDSFVTVNSKTEGKAMMAEFQFKVIKELGTGGYGSVFQCEMLVNDIKFAMKICGNEEIKVSRIMSEAHCGIIPVKATHIKCVNKCQYLMPSMNGSLQDLLPVMKNLFLTDINLFRKLAVDIVNTIRHQLICIMCNTSLTYTDVKLPNILFRVEANNHITIRLGDLGSLQINQSREYVTTFPLPENKYNVYISKKFIDANKFSATSYWIGILLYCLAGGYTPFDVYDDLIEVKHTVDGKLPYYKDNHHSRLVCKFMSHIYGKTIANYLSTDPKQRPSLYDKIEYGMHVDDTNAYLQNAKTSLQKEEMLVVSSLLVDDFKDWKAVRSQSQIDNNWLSTGLIYFKNETNTQLELPVISRKKIS
jgi:serine/threonine protein kinase